MHQTMKVLNIKALLIFLGILAVFMVAISIYRGVQINSKTQGTKPRNLIRCHFFKNIL